MNRILKASKLEYLKLHKYLGSSTAHVLMNVADYYMTLALGHIADKMLDKALGRLEVNLLRSVTPNPEKSQNCKFKSLELLLF